MGLKVTVSHKIEPAAPMKKTLRKFKEHFDGNKMNKQRTLTTVVIYHNGKFVSVKLWSNVYAPIPSPTKKKKKN